MSICTESTGGPREPVLQVVVAARVFLGQRVNLQEKYDYPDHLSTNEKAAPRRPLFPSLFQASSVRERSRCAQAPQKVFDPLIRHHVVRPRFKITAVFQ